MPTWRASAAARVSLIRALPGPSRSPVIEADDGDVARNPRPELGEAEDRAGREVIVCTQNRVGRLALLHELLGEMEP